MNNPSPIFISNQIKTFFIILFLLLISTNLYSISLVSRVNDLDNKVTMIQERQEQLIQLIEANQ